MLDVQHQAYRLRGEAYVCRLPAPIRPLTSPGPDGSFRAAWSAAGPPDYLVIAGRTLLVEAKQTKEARWKFGLLKPYQADQLTAAAEHGAIGVLVVRYMQPGTRRTCALLWRDLEPVWRAWYDEKPKARASLNYEEAALLACWTGAGVDYLGSVLGAA